MGVIEYEPHEGLFAKLRRFFSGGTADAPLSGEGAAVDAPAGSAEGRDESFGRNGTRRVSSGSTTWSAPPLSQEEQALVAKGDRPAPRPCTGTAREWPIGRPSGSSKRRPGGSRTWSARRQSLPRRRIRTILRHPR